jgi:hypothetical protein
MMDYGQQAASLGKDLQEKGYSADDIQLAMIAAGLIPKPDNMSKEAKDVINFLYEQIPGIGSERALADAIKSGNPEDLIYVVLPILKGINSIKPMDKTDPVGDFIKSEQGSVPLGKGTAAGKVDDVVDAGKGTSQADLAGATSKDKIPGPTANWNNYTHAEAVIKTENSGKLANADKAVIDPNKVTSYALNTGHPVGGNKAKVFESALGYNQSNANELISKIQAGAKTNTAVLGKADNHGQRITIDMPITGANGKTAIVRTGWIYDPGSSTPRLTTLYVK